MARRGQRSALAAIGVVAALLLTSCTQGSSGSRAHLYESIDDLVGDSRAIVRGWVQGSAAVDVNGMAFTAFSFTIHEQFFPEGLGQTRLDEGAEPFDVTELETNQIIIRQVSRSNALSAFPLVPEMEYLLFLVPSELEGDPDDTFYITGAVAGMYMAEDDGFIRMSNEDPDLPSVLRPEQLY